MILPNRSVPYVGKVTACHSLGLLDAFCATPAPDLLLLFDAMTGVPFGVKTLPDDANRLLTPWLDPDRGLDVALDALGVQFEVVFWQLGADACSALERLREWSSQGPVLLGPLDMGYLPYSFHGQIYRGCDHYVVVLGWEDHRIAIRDSEGFDMVWLPCEDVVKAWRGDSIPEGRGAFVMRRVLPAVPPLPASRFLPRPSAIYCAVRHAAALLRESAAAPQGGSNAYAALADHEATILEWPAARRGLSYVLATRIQRNVSGLALLERLSTILPRACDVVAMARSITQRQSAILARCRAALPTAAPGCLAPLYDLARLEDRLTTAYESLEDVA